MFKMFTRQILRDKATPISLPDEPHGGPHRLLLLENAVTNYGGGIVNLESRVRYVAKALHDSEPPASQLLEDVACYLRNIAAAGELDIDEWVNEPKDRRGNA